MNHSPRTTRATLLGLIALLFYSIPAAPQADTAPPKPKPTVSPNTKSSAIPIPDIPYTRFVLPNGLTVIVHEDHKAPIVAVNTWYHVGSKNEKPGKTGFAHLFEHLMFSGSENFNFTYINAMERIGATDLNGTTNNDRTNFFENVPTSMLDYVLFAESDRMGHLLPVLDQENSISSAAWYKTKSARAKISRTASPSNSSPKTPIRQAIPTPGR